jgi:hypothetical protein
MSHPISATDRRDRFRVGRCGKYSRTEETKNKQRERARQFWADPDNRARQSALTKAAMARARQDQAQEGSAQ